MRVSNSLNGLKKKYKDGYIVRRGRKLFFKCKTKKRLNTRQG